MSMFNYNNISKVVDKAVEQIAEAIAKQITEEVTAISELQSEQEAVKAIQKEVYGSINFNYMIEKKLLDMFELVDEEDDQE